MRRVKCNSMKNHCDIYKVTLTTRYSETETGGLHEQESDKGIFQSDIRAVSEGFKRNKADHFKRILFQYWVQPEVCYPEIKWPHPSENHYYTPGAGGNIPTGRRFYRFCLLYGRQRGYPCSARLKALIKLWLPWIRKQFQLKQQVEKQLLSISARQMDRRLKDKKGQVGRRMYGRTKPGTLPKHHIPIRTDNWDIKTPGWTEVDTVSHSGNSADGEFAYTINQTDILTTWVESRAVGKTEDVMVEGLDEMAHALPFPLKGLDSDNGSEFVNWHIWRYCKRNKIQPFRGRPYKKDDNAYIEQKNWTHVRKLMGWDRYDTQEAVDAMNDLYRNELRLFMNLFMPSMKLIRKERIGSKLKRYYDKPLTPFERVIASKKGDPIKITELKKLMML